MIQGSPKATDRSISFCAKDNNAVGYLPVKANVGAAGCVGCDCMNWTIALTDDNTIVSELHMAGTQTL